MNQRINIGVIGVGTHANQSHIEYLTQLPRQCQITALSDINPAAMEATSDRYGLERATQHREDDGMGLLSDPDIDAVIISTPDWLHTRQLVGAVAAGKHVLCEKPLATDWDDMRSLGGALVRAAETGLVVTTCHPRRFDPPFLKAREYIYDQDAISRDFPFRGDLGTPRKFSFDFQYSRPSKHGLHTSLMFDHLNHEVDSMHMLFGTGQLAEATRHYDSETAYKVTGRRQDGLEFDFIGARLLDEPNVYAETMTIEGEDATLKLDMWSGLAKIIRNRIIIPRYMPEDYQTNYTTRFMNLNKHFLDAIATGGASYVSSEEMLINTHAAIQLHDEKPISSGHGGIVVY